MTYLKGCTIQWAAFAYAICITGVSVAVWLVQAPYTTTLYITDNEVSQTKLPILLTITTDDILYTYPHSSSPPLITA